MRDNEVPPETVRRTFEETWRIHPSTGAPGAGSRP